ncbi:MAG: formylmethanofuran dehydrogenase subunit C [Gammaproteobacteria bacterium]|nr:formylmethanofuran dehydrogenase subunit C [Gammaproteobacteria bacterium]
MSHTLVTYKGSTQMRIDMRWLSEALNQSSSADQVKSHSIFIGNQQIPIGDLFDISADDFSDSVVLENSHDKMDYIGFELQAKHKIKVEGDCGHYTGAQLAGGKLKIKGNTLDYTASNMRKGIIKIDGNCGHYAGSAMAGTKKGMSGGTLLVHGNSGDFTGDLMRRGLIMVEGDIGDYCASRMIAGTITNLGGIGKQVGVGMRRGTLLLPHKPEDMSTGFKDYGRHNLGYLTLLLHELRRFESRFQSLHPMRRRVQRYQGDIAVGGQGELLVWIG